MTGQAFLGEARRRLPDHAAHEALWMLADAQGITATDARLRLPEALPADVEARLTGWLMRRAAGEPLSYITGVAYFMGHAFQVDRRVLIPRADSEILCEQAIERARMMNPDVLDLCTGSGALACSIALKCPNARVVGADLSEAALAVARGNAARLRARVEFVQGDFFDAVRGRTFDVIACNPPYLSADDMRALDREVKWEPGLALDGGDDGLLFYRRAARELGQYLRPGGWALFEVGAGQADAVAALLGGEIHVYQDLSAIARVVETRRA